MASRHWLQLGDGPAGGTQVIDLDHETPFSIPVVMVNSGSSRIQAYPGIYRQPRVRTYSDQIASVTKPGDLREFTFSIFMQGMPFDEILWNWAQVNSFLDRAEAFSGLFPRGLGLVLVELQEDAEWPSYWDVASGIFTDIDMNMPGFDRIGGVIQLAVAPFARGPQPLLIPQTSLLTNGPACKLYIPNVLGDADAPFELTVEDDSDGGHNISRVTAFRRWHPLMASTDFTPAQSGTGSITTSQNFQLVEAYDSPGGPHDSGYYGVVALVNDASPVLGQPQNVVAALTTNAGLLGSDTLQAVLAAYDSSKRTGRLSGTVITTVQNLVQSGGLVAPVTVLDFDNAESQQWIGWKAPPLYNATAAGGFIRIDNSSPIDGGYSFHFKAVGDSNIGSLANGTVTRALPALPTSKIKSMRFTLDAASWAASYLFPNIPSGARNATTGVVPPTNVLYYIAGVDSAGRIGPLSLASNVVQGGQGTNIITIGDLEGAAALQSWTITPTSAVTGGTPSVQASTAAADTGARGLSISYGSQVTLVGGATPLSVLVPPTWQVPGGSLHVATVGPTTRFQWRAKHISITTAFTVFPPATQAPGAAAYLWGTTGVNIATAAIDNTGTITGWTLNGTSPPVAITVPFDNAWHTWQVVTNATTNGTGTADVYLDGTHLGQMKFPWGVTIINNALALNFDVGAYGIGSANSNSSSSATVNVYVDNAIALNAAAFPASTDDEIQANTDTISWSAITGAAHYRVYAQIPAASNDIVLFDNVVGTSLAISDLRTGIASTFPTPTVGDGAARFSCGAQVANPAATGTYQFNGVQLVHVSGDNSFNVIGYTGSGTTTTPGPNGAYTTTPLGTVTLTPSTLYFIEFNYDASGAESVLRLYVTPVVSPPPNTDLAAGFSWATSGVEPTELTLATYASGQGTPVTEEYRVDDFIVGDHFIGGIAGIGGGAAVTYSWKANTDPNTTGYYLYITTSNGTTYQYDVGNVTSYMLTNLLAAGVTLVLSPPTGPPAVLPAQLELRTSAGTTNTLSLIGRAIRPFLANGNDELVFFPDAALPPGTKSEYLPPNLWHLEVWAKSGSTINSALTVKGIWRIPRDEPGFTGFSVQAPGLNQQVIWKIGTDRWARSYCGLYSKSDGHLIGTVPVSGRLMLREGDNLLGVLLESDNGAGQWISDITHLKAKLNAITEPRFHLGATPVPIF